ncbi:MAG TPA: hypothetical protein VGL61_33280 [Kofleriaceae bacterium]
MSREEAIKAAVEGTGRSSVEARRAAFANGDDVPEPARALIAKLVRDATTVTDDDMRAVAASLGEDATYELVVCAALGQATRQLDAALAMLDEDHT